MKTVDVALNLSFCGRHNCAKSQALKHVHFFYLPFILLRFCCCCVNDFFFFLLSLAASQFSFFFLLFFVRRFLLSLKGVHLYYELYSTQHETKKKKKTQNFSLFPGSFLSLFTRSTHAHLERHTPPQKKCRVQASTTVCLVHTRPAPDRGEGEGRVGGTRR